MNPCPGSPLLRSFWMGGYEGADHVNADGQALDMVRATGHLARIDEDYRRAARLGLLTLRESIGWRLSERSRGVLDLSRAVHIAQAARRAGIQPLWTLMHYGLPPDLSLFDDALVERFARFAGAVARTLRPLCPGPRFYTPINEISFLAWAASTDGLLWRPGGAANHDPEGQGEASSERSGYLIKRRLVRAALAGMTAIRAEDPQARFLHVEPLVHVAAPIDQAELAPLAQQIRDYQWQALDLLSGRLEPELGGHPEALDWLGFNHYHNSQWEAQTERRLPWHLRDPRCQPLSSLLQQAWQRYGRPLLIAETGHVGMGRAAWLHEMAGEALQARALGLPLQGICLYPLLDRPDWQEPGRWHRCGMWQLNGDQALPPGRTPDSRMPVQAYARALQLWRPLPLPPTSCRRRLLVLLPVRWESLDVSLQHLLRRLSGEASGSGPSLRPGECFSVLLVEPSRRHEGPPRLHRHRLGPAVELVVRHGPEADEGWASVWQDLTLLLATLEPAPQGGTLTWLMRWPLDRPLEPATLPGDALALQPDEQALTPGCPGLPMRPDLLLCEAPQQAARWAETHTRVLRLPLGLPAPCLRPPPAASYEDREVSALLGPSQAPRLLVFARPHQPPDPPWLEALAQLRPHWQFFMMGSHAPPQGRWPENCRGLGELAPELLPALLQACDAGLVLAPTGEATAHLWPELLCLGAGARLPVVSTPLAELVHLPAQAGLRIARDAASMASEVDTLLRQPRTRSGRGTMAREARRQRQLEQDLIQAFIELLAARRAAHRPAAQQASGPADARAAPVASPACDR
ncbi:hypothetical protein ACS5PK_01325 [Roseateles sp. DB2]|uniref:hypothetical protein n=1 Tax=Roseateles sp. DB2 TaxID=3453717 RepID=UPI003EEFEF54